LINGGKEWVDPDFGISIANDYYIGGSPDGYRENLGWAGTSGQADGLPSVTITAPANNSVVFGTVAITANASDDVGVTQVEFFVDGQSIGIGIDTNGTGGWSVNWDTETWSEGSHTVTATATDTAEHTASDGVTFSVDNQNDVPTVAITNPADTSTVSGSITVTANAADDRGVTQVEFFVDGTSIGYDADGTNGWTVSWDTTRWPDGPYTLTATATDSDSAQSTSDLIVVSVNNTVREMSASLTPSARLIGRSSKWQASVTVKVVDTSGVGLLGARVNGNWDGSPVSGISGDGGSVTFSTTLPIIVTEVTFSVTDILLDGYDYDGIVRSTNVPISLASSKVADLDILASYLVSTSGYKQQSAKNDTDDQIKAVDLLMAYGL
jgi:hypothetical protein